MIGNFGFPSVHLKMIKWNERPQQVIILPVVLGIACVRAFFQFGWRVSIIYKHSLLLHLARRRMLFFTT